MTIVRASWFNQNFSEAFLLEPLVGGLLALPAGAVLEPFIDTDDLAKATGRDLSYVEISREQFISQMQEHHLPSEAIGLTSYLF